MSWATAKIDIRPIPIDIEVSPCASVIGSKYGARHRACCQDRQSRRHHQPNCQNQRQKNKHYFSHLISSLSPFMVSCQLSDRILFYLTPRYYPSLFVNCLTKCHS